MEVSITNEALDIHQGYVYMQMTAFDNNEREAARMLYAVRDDLDNHASHSCILSLDFPLGYDKGVARQMVSRLAQDVGPSFEFDIDKATPAQQDIETRFSFPVVHPVLYDTLQCVLELRKDMANIDALTASGRLSEHNRELLLENRMSKLDGPLSKTLEAIGSPATLEIRSFNPKLARSAYGFAMKRIEELGKGINETPPVPMLDEKRKHVFSLAGLKKIHRDLGQIYVSLQNGLAKIPRPRGVVHA